MSTPDGHQDTDPRALPGAIALTPLGSDDAPMCVDGVCEVPEDSP